MSQFLKGFSNYGFGGVSLRSMGRVVYSDFREGMQELVDRQQAAQMIQAAMDSLRSEGLLLMVSGGNDIAFPYAKHIVGAPTEGSNMHFFDECTRSTKWHCTVISIMQASLSIPTPNTDRRC